MFSDSCTFEITSNDLRAGKGFSLYAIVRNEIFMLPAFLRHYRSLGVQRFVILDDRSDDGSFEFLSEQPDVMVVADRDNTFGGTATVFVGARALEMSTKLLWRTMLMRQFGSERWGLMVDADEFVALPSGWSLEDLAARASMRNAVAAGGVMLDTYPRVYSDLERSTSLSLAGSWYFDAQQHFELSSCDGLRQLYAGARARLLAKYGVVKCSARLKLRNLLRDPWYPYFNYNWKTILHYWRSSDHFVNSHKTTAEYSADLMVPIRHFKFSAASFTKVPRALIEKQHWNGSAEYEALSTLLRKMQQLDGRFLYRKSRLANDFDAFEDSGNARL